jgi:hypothetical protein
MSGGGEVRGRLTRTLTVGGVIISVMAGGVSLLFTLQPDLKPCLGDSDAEFTAAPVFPQTSLHAFLRRSDLSNAELRDVVEQRGAEIRFSYHTDGLRERELAVTSTLLTIEADGTLGRVVEGHDRKPQFSLSPAVVLRPAETTCSSRFRRGRAGATRSSSSCFATNNSPTGSR